MIISLGLCLCLVWLTAADEETNPIENTPLSEDDSIEDESGLEKIYNLYPWIFDEDNSSEEDKRAAPGVMRFGKKSAPGVMRFGKRDSPGVMRFGKRDSPGVMRFGKKDAPGVMRFGKRDSPGVMRFGKKDSPGVMRFGK